MLAQWLRRQAEALNLSLSEQALQQFQLYAQLLQHWNQELNLTTISEAQEVYELHFLDSLSVVLALDLESVTSVIDVGSGAGFPGLALAIALPSLKVTLLESIQKKARFLQTVVTELGLGQRVGVVSERAEVVGQQPELRQQHDVAVARAVARLAVLAEYCLPLVKVGGCFVAQKGPELGPELAESLPAIAALGGAVAKQQGWSLPSGAARTLVRIDKLQPTPLKYPRRAGIAAKRPLL